MSTKPPTLRLAESAALFLSGSLTGLSFASTILLVPRLLESPVPLMLTQWTNAYIWGKTYMGPTALATSSIYLYLASRAGKGTSRANAYIAAAVLMVGIVPYTLGVMFRTNQKLQGRARVAERVGRGEVVAERERGGIEEEGAWEVKVEGSRYLVDHWGILNLGRTAMLTAGAALGLYATL